MKSYYDEDGIRIYHGDALDVLDEWEGLRCQPFDLLLTDPPYGLNHGTHRLGSGVIRRRSGFFAGTGSTGPSLVDYGPSSAWDRRIRPDVLTWARSLSRWQIVFGGNFYDLPATSCVLVWHKEITGDFADCELAWTNLPKAVQMLTYRWNGMLQEPGVPREVREHPTQKPEAVMRWALMQAPAFVQSVLDPFMGSGTTLVAAKRLRREAVGIELDERYCEIAARRLSQGVLPLPLEERQEPEQQHIAWT